MHNYTSTRHSALLIPQPSTYKTTHTVDREIFTLKIIRVKNFGVDKFSRFRSIRKIFLTVNGYNLDEHLESSERLVYYQVTGEPGILAVVVDRTFTMGGVDFTCMPTH